MELSKYRRNLGKVAAVLGVLQAITWTFLTLLAIILHYWQPEVSVGSSYTRIMEIWLYHKFLVDDGSLSEMEFSLTPDRFIIAMWIFFVDSVLWGSISVDLLAAIHGKKKRQIIMMRIWGIATFIMSWLDFVFVLLLGLDYAACGAGGSVGVTQLQYVCYTSIGVAMAIAARGFTLWLINLLLSIFLVKESFHAKKEDDSNESLYSTIPRARLVNKLFPFRHTHT